MHTSRNVRFMCLPKKADRASALARTGTRSPSTRDDRNIVVSSAPKISYDGALKHCATSSSRTTSRGRPPHLGDGDTVADRLVKPPVQVSRRNYLEKPVGLRTSNCRGRCRSRAHRYPMRAGGDESNVLPIANICYISTSVHHVTWAATLAFNEHVTRQESCNHTR